MIKHVKIMATYWYAPILGILMAAVVCHAFIDSSLWEISVGKECVQEFISKDINLRCNKDCLALTVSGRPDEIFVLSEREDILKRLRKGEAITGIFQKVHVLNLKSMKVALIDIESFIKLDILLEDLHLYGYDEHSAIKYAGNPSGHGWGLSAIKRNGKEFISALSSERVTSTKTTFGIPGIIPFFGRSEWFQKEEYHTGTLFLEVFDTRFPTKPVVQLQKKFEDQWLLPWFSDFASWVQGSKDPALVVVDHRSFGTEKEGRILVFRLK